MKTMKNNEQWKCSLIRLIALLELIKKRSSLSLSLCEDSSSVVGSQSLTDNIVWLETPVRPGKPRVKAR